MIVVLPKERFPKNVICWQLKYHVYGIKESPETKYYDYTKDLELFSINNNDT